jgi:mycothiol synthase
MAPPPLRAVEPPEFAAVRTRIARIEAAATGATGHASLGEATWRDLDVAPPESAGFLVDGAAYAHVARSDNFSPRHWVLGLTVDPAVGDGEARDLRGALVDAALAHVRAHGGGRVVHWQLGATGAADPALAQAGFEPDRELYEMRVPLPVAARPSVPEGIEVRTFAPGDERAWLDVNNRAFANHPEQGDWVEATLARRMTEPWFDPTLFFLAFDRDGLAGFNWMKIHDAHGRDPSLGEIFVIGVDPRVHARGLGRALAIIGLDAVHRRGIETGSLFCAADNVPALRLYRSLGFAVHRVDRAYVREVSQ